MRNASYHINAIKQEEASDNLMQVMENFANATTAD